jgi:REP element-mobilizing transposase RayT
MNYDPGIHHRRSIRLRGHDYAGGGAYFVTACIQGEAPLLGQIVENEMVPSESGRLVEATWQALPRRFPSVLLDTHLMMPNHFHGIIVIPGPGLDPSLAKATGAPIIQPSLHGVVGPGLAPAKADASVGPTARRVGLFAVVGAFKSLCALAVNQALARAGKHLWQEDYYEHIIRNVEELEKTRDYIIHNPARWVEDPENPGAGPGLTPAQGRRKRRPYSWKEP